jgi:hypothetical protein
MDFPPLDVDAGKGHETNRHDAGHAERDADTP